ncbi:MAG: D-alanine--D-alanine ligase [Spirosomataceae bacterium]
MRIGIFFGGVSREREISFLGGKTALENIDKSLFTAIPVFVDGKGNFILINEDLIYRPEIRDFYPPASFVPDSFKVYSESLELSADDEERMIATVGKRLYPHEFGQHFDYVFIAMHGPGCEDGTIQGLLEWYGIPYHGPDILSSGISMDKIYQNYLIEKTVGLDKKTATLTKSQFFKGNPAELFNDLKTSLGLPFVVKAPHQGSSIGVSFVKEDSVEAFEKAVKQCLFITEINASDWKAKSDEEKVELLQKTANLDEGIAFPLEFRGEIIKHPSLLWKRLDAFFSMNSDKAILTSVDTEDAVLFEAFVNGQEFSCGVIQDFEGNAIALPPTEIVKLDEEVIVFDFKTKYKKTTTRKNIPINTELANNQKVQQMVRDCFTALKFGVCTRIDGFLTPDGRVLLHDPNTIPGMSPASLIFKQMAEIGLNVTDSITYFIRNSIRERIRSGKKAVPLRQLLQQLDEAIRQKNAKRHERERIVVVFGGAVEADESYGLAKKAFSQLSASGDYVPVCVYVNASGEKFVLPTSLMFKETVADLEVLLQGAVHPLIEETRQKAQLVTQFFTGGPVPSPRQIEAIEPEGVMAVVLLDGLEVDLPSGVI